MRLLLLYSSFYLLSPIALLQGDDEEDAGVLYQYSSVCPGPMLRALTVLFQKSGYKPYTLDYTPLDPEQSHSWTETHLIWRHDDAPDEL